MSGSYVSSDLNKNKKNQVNNQNFTSGRGVAQFYNCSGLFCSKTLICNRKSDYTGFRCILARSFTSEVDSINTPYTMKNDFKRSYQSSNYVFDPKKVQAYCGIFWSSSANLSSFFIIEKNSNLDKFQIKYGL